MTYEEQRVLAGLAARAAVLDLSVTQRRAFEAADLETWIGSFVVDGTLELPGGARLVGHVALGRWFAGADHRRRVLGADPVVHADRVTATQRSTLVVLGGPGPGDQARRALYEVDDDLVYERGRWYFVRRTVSEAPSPPGAPGRRP
jgi:SnoaL-like domain